jgi:hypothetical protein
MSEAAMSEIEQRLRAAMHGAVGEEQPPPNLLERVKTRRHRHRAAATAVCLAVVAAGALAVLPAGSALRGGTAPGRESAGSALAPAPRAAPGTVLDACSRQIGEQLGSNWRRQAVHVGPLWLLGLRQAVNTQSAGQFGLGGFSVDVKDNAKAWVRVVGAATRYFRFLFGPSDFVNGVKGPYTLKDGESGVTFVGCRSDMADNEPPGYTMYGGYFLVSKPPRCVSLDVWTAGSSRPAQVTFPVGDVTCGARG